MPLRSFRALTLGLLLSGSAVAAQPSNDVPDELARYAGQIVYVDFWASWCGPCAQAFPWLDTLQTRYGSRLQVIAVNVDQDRADADRFLAAHPASFPVVFDPEGHLAEHYHVAGMPSAVILGRDGRILHQHVGFREDETADYEHAIAGAFTSSAGGSAP